MSYTVICGAVPHISAEFYTFPTGCRISGGGLTRRENLVHIPFVDGTKDIGDGTLEGGDVTVSGRIWAASGAAAIELVERMERKLLEHAGVFYVWQYWVGETPWCYRVHGCKSVVHEMPEGPGGKWIDITCVFSRGPDPSMVAGA